MSIVIIECVYIIMFFLILEIIIRKNSGIIEYLSHKSMKKLWLITFIIGAIIGLSSTLFQSYARGLLRSTAFNIIFGFSVLYFYVDDYRKKI